MKPFHPFIVALIGLSFITAEAEARGGGARGGGGGARGGGGGARGGGGGGMRGGGGGGMRSSGGGTRRSPATGSAMRPSSRPAQRPSGKPAQRPANRPSQLPSNKPGPPDVGRPGAGKPDIGRPGGGGRPEVGGPGGPGGNRPGAGRPGSGRPDVGKPGINGGRPGGNRPSTLPGMVGYPNRPGAGNRPGGGNRFGDRQIGLGDVNSNRRNNALTRPSQLPAGGRGNWNANNWGGNRGIWGNNTNINIDNNFRNNNNFGYGPNHWGGHPWWGAGHAHGWHHGHWGHGWNHGWCGGNWWYDDDFGEGFMWGMAAWGLGSMIYNMGYQSYSNPYPAPPVENTTVVYTQPLSVSASASPSGDEQTLARAEDKSTDALDASRAAFKSGDYTTALRKADEAIAATPDDVTLHEYRALVLFALGRFSDAAGVLNPVLASGPGWGWETMIGFYDSSTTYTSQLRRLETWVKNSPSKAEGHFLLGYHYLTCGYMENAYDQFGKAAELQPADSISRQLRDLAKNSLPDGDKDEPDEPAPKPDLVPSDKLVGAWTAKAPAGGKIAFTLGEDGNFTWNFTGGGQTGEMKGTWGIDDKGLLILTADDSQMISSAVREGDAMRFQLIGGPSGDPGLLFTKG